MQVSGAETSMHLIATYSQNFMCCKDLLSTDICTWCTEDNRPTANMYLEYKHITVLPYDIEGCIMTPLITCVEEHIQQRQVEALYKVFSSPLIFKTCFD